MVRILRAVWNGFPCRSTDGVTAALGIVTTHGDRVLPFVRVDAPFPAGRTRASSAVLPSMEKVRFPGWGARLGVCVASARGAVRPGCVCGGQGPGQTEPALAPPCHTEANLLRCADVTKCVGAPQRARDRHPTAPEPGQSRAWAARTRRGHSGMEGASASGWVARECAWSPGGVGPRVTPGSTAKRWRGVALGSRNPRKQRGWNEGPRVQASEDTH